MPRRLDLRRAGLQGARSQEVWRLRRRHARQERRRGEEEATGGCCPPCGASSLGDVVRAVSKWPHHRHVTSRPQRSLASAMRAMSPVKKFPTTSMCSPQSSGLGQSAGDHILTKGMRCALSKSAGLSVTCRGVYRGRKVRRRNRVGCTDIRANTTDCGKERVKGGAVTQSRSHCVKAVTARLLAGGAGSPEACAVRARFGSC